MQEQNTYNHFMHTNITNLNDNDDDHHKISFGFESSITLNDIVKCTSKKSNIIVRFFNRLIRLNKGWINDSKVEKLLGKLADTPEKRNRLNGISEIMVGYSDSFYRASADIADQMKWIDKYNESISIIKKFQIESNELEQLVFKINNAIHKNHNNSIKNEKSIEKRNSQMVSFQCAEGKNLQDPGTIRTKTKQIKQERIKIKINKKIIENITSRLKNVDVLQMISNVSKLRSDFEEYLIKKEDITVSLENLDSLYKNFVTDLAQSCTNKEDYKISYYNNFDQKTLQKKNGLDENNINSLNKRLIKRRTSRLSG